MTEPIDLKHLLMEERRRIAEEWHDRVSPPLFGIVYAIHALNRDWDSLSDDCKQTQLAEIQEAAATAARELRSAICGLSMAKRSGSSWLDAVEAYLANQAKLNGVRIRFRAPESDDGLNEDQRNALFRMIAEGVGNAIRHGASSIVDVRITREPGAVLLGIVDNGTGFDPRAQRCDPATDSGFGLSNMRMMTASLGGTIAIDSRVGNGTRIRVRLPLQSEVEDSTHPLTAGG